MFNRCKHSNRPYQVAALLFLFLFAVMRPALAEKKTSLGASEIYQKLSSLVFGGQQERALQFLKKSGTKNLKGAWRDRLSFLSAILYLKAENYEKAIELLKPIAKTYVPLQDYVEFYLAVALRESGKAKEAIHGFQNLKQYHASAYLNEKIDRELALSYCKAGDRGHGVDMLNGMIQNSISPQIEQRLRYDRARCLIDTGDKAEASALLKKFYLDYPESELSQEIRQTLQKLDPAYRLSATDHIRRAELLLQRGRPELAVIDFEETEKILGRGDLRLKKQIADAYFKARKYREAAAAMEEIRRENGGATIEELEKLARAYARSDQFDAAIATYQELMNAQGRSADYLYKIAFLYMDKGDHATALEKFTELIRQFPAHPQRDTIGWYIAWNRYLLGDYDQALIGFESLNGKFAKRAPYWLARTHEKKGEFHLAEDLYRQIAAAEPYSYYGFLSLKRLERNLSPDLPPKNGWTKNLPTLKVPKPFSAAASNDDKKSVGRVKELLIVGLWGDFLGELNLLATQESAPHELTQLKNQLTRAESGTPFSDNGSWTQKYPAAYPTLVPLFTHTRNLPAALAWAIMREESHFRPSVVSAANAIGLMQIIPPTGFEIAEALGHGDFSAQQLQKPAVNIEFGVHYLAMNMARFDGNLLYTIASYNAGPDAVERWTKSRPNREWDEFIEEIPYDETNNYVKKVLKSYYLYALLYPM